MTLLIVDADTGLASSCVGAARERRIVTTSDTDDAIRIASSEPLDAAVIEVSLKLEIGVDLVSRLRRRDPMLPIIAMTAERSPRVGFAACRAGADTVLEKPVPLAEIERSIRAIRERPRALTLLAQRDAYIASVVEACDGNKSEAARRLGVHRYSLQRMLAKRPALASPRPTKKR